MGFEKEIQMNYDKWLDRIKTFIPINDAGDVLNSVLLSMLERELDVENDVDCLECYIVSSCKLAYRSPNSPYNRQLERHKHFLQFDDAIASGEYIEDADNDDDEMKKIDIFKLIQESPFSWYEKELFKRRLLENDGKTLKQMAIECNLSPSQVWYTHRKIKNYLKDKIKEIN